MGHIRLSALSDISDFLHSCKFHSLHACVIERERRKREREREKEHVCESDSMHVFVCMSERGSWVRAKGTKRERERKYPAEARSGRSDLLSSSDFHIDRPAPSHDTASTTPLPTPSSTYSQSCKVCVCVCEGVLVSVYVCMCACWWLNVCLCVCLCVCVCFSAGWCPSAMEIWVLNFARLSFIQTSILNTMIHTTMRTCVCGDKITFHMYNLACYCLLTHLNSGHKALWRYSDPIAH